ncbi:diguanylate cyclase [Escherichia coli]|nr:diguanylate cyclase [Escherichia coli]MCN9561950.1 diguanylate cyclase [Escherichia coli]
MIKKTTEIDAILLNLNKAIDAHYQWLVSMFRSVVARDASKPDEPLNLYLMLLDIDRFKLVNDTYGHLIGDVVLRTLATYLASWTRDYETVYRYGGEEFIIIVKATNDEEACRAGVRICQLVDNHAITHSEGHINITVTAGVSRAFPEEPLDVVIGRADRAMYEGKQTGRNRCMFIDEQNVINRV